MCQIIEVVVDYVDGVVQVFLLVCVVCQVGEVGGDVCVFGWLVIFVEGDVCDVEGEGVVCYGWCFVCRVIFRCRLVVFGI